MMDNEQKLRGLSQEIAGLVRQSADITTIRAKMQQAANLQVDVSIEDIQTGRAISAILTPSQRKQWADIQTQLRVQQGAIPPPNK
jgi:Spy/CpxP family protein refolding chaperone